MARTWTERRIAAAGTAKARDVSEEMAAIAREVNGNLDQHNIPVASIGRAKLRNGTVAEPGATLSTYLATSSYHRSLFFQADGTTAQDTLDPGADEFGMAWVPLADLTNSDHGTVLEFTGREGMLTGQAVVDFELRNNFVRVTSTLPSISYATRHLDDYIQLGVFVNGVLVADSGPISPRRFTLDLPFCCPAPPGEVRVETRVKLVVQRQPDDGYTNADGTVYEYPAGDGALQYPAVKFYGTALYARNKYR